MLKKILVVAALSAVSVLAVADEYDAHQAAKQVIELTDGSTVYVFKDGKMAEESKFGNVMYVKPGTALQTKDGGTITMVGNEVARLSTLLRVPD